VVVAKSFVLKGRGVALGPVGMMWRHSLYILRFLHPHPYSVKKFLIFRWLQTGCGCKVFLRLDLSAESSK